MVVPAALKVVRLKPTRKVSLQVLLTETLGILRFPRRGALRALGLADDGFFSRWSADATAGSAENANGSTDARRNREPCQGGCGCAREGVGSL